MTDLRNETLNHGKLPCLSRLALVVCTVIYFFPAKDAQATERHKTEHTLVLEEGERPEASITDVAWLAGSWQGEGFGGTIEEVWSDPSAGSMMGMFKLMHNGEPSMYELELIVEEQDTLVLKVKHFEADFAAWEDKNQFLSFRLVKLTDDAAYFEGLTFKRIGADKLDVYLAAKKGDEFVERHISYNRAANES